jgi:PAS domain S-box-containing protein
MAVAERLRQSATRPEAAPALFRLLAEASLSRSALDACRMPVALADAASASRPLCYVNQAFEAFFGYRAAESLGRPAASLLFAEAQAEPLFREPASPRTLCARRKDGSPVHVEVAVGVIRGSDGRVTHWVLSFADRSELEQLRDRLGALRG